MGCLAEAPSLPADAQPLQTPVLRCKRLTDPCLFYDYRPRHLALRVRHRTRHANRLMVLLLIVIVILVLEGGTALLRRGFRRPFEALACFGASRGVLAGGGEGWHGRTCLQRRRLGFHPGTAGILLLRSGPCGLLRCGRQPVTGSPLQNGLKRACCPGALPGACWSCGFLL
jgi:hypothetical protein